MKKIIRFAVGVLLLAGFQPGLLITQAAEGDTQDTTRSFQLDGNELKLPTAVVFQTGSDQLDETDTAALEHAQAYLQAKRYITRMRIEVHSDASGNPATAQDLTEKRALSVGRWLVKQGIDCKRLLPTGFGSSKPIADEATPVGKAQNRRVAFVNAQLAGKAIGGMPEDGGGKVAGDLCSQ